MAEIQPFKIVRYSDEHTAELGNLITPPYDVISPSEQEAFYEASPLNVIRLVLGKQFPQDDEKDNKYTRAASTLNDWLDRGVLRQDEQVGVTVYQMEFDHPEGGRVTLDGIVCLVRVDDYGKGRVLPHEKTYKGPKLDQLNLMRACRANLTPIHALFPDADAALAEKYSGFITRPPDQEVTDAQGTVHRTWAIHDRDFIEYAKGLLADKSVFIADGHHRYETAMAFRREIREATGDDSPGPQDWVMMYLTSMSHPGLTILPAHRMVKGLEGLEIGAALKTLEPYFNIEELPFSPERPDEILGTVLERIANYSDIGGKFGMAVQGESCFRLLRLRDFSSIESLMDESIPSALKGLDVTILREVIMAHGLGLNGENVEGHLEYAPLVSEVVRKVMNGEVQIGFILNPTRVDQVQTAAELGHKLPHKSTYFYPKLSSGLGMCLFRDMAAKA